VAKTLSALPSLQYVDLGFDSIEGPLDSACGLAKTKTLASLNLMNNQISGSIPACITQLPTMVELHLDFNQLTGAIPAFYTTDSPLTYFTAAYQVTLCAAVLSPCNNRNGKPKSECPYGAAVSLLYQC